MVNRATHSGILAWKIPWTERNQVGSTVQGVAKSRSRGSRKEQLTLYGE